MPNPEVALDQRKAHAAKKTRLQKNTTRDLIWIKQVYRQRRVIITGMTGAERH
jgi:hypothetical protein